MPENSPQRPTPQAKRAGSRRPASADQERLVRRYLSVLESGKPGRGTRRAAGAVGNRITKIDELLVSADPLSRLHLTQERIELHAEYVRLTNGNHVDPSQLERDFARVVRSYGDRNGITYAAWRQVGVDAKLLERAGIHKAEKKAPPAAIRAAEKGGAVGPVAEATPEVPAEAPQGPVDTTPDPAPAPAEDTVEPTAGPTAAAGNETPAGSDIEDSDAPAADAGNETAADAGNEVAGEVSLDELANLLAEAGSGQAASEPAAPDQPSLGDDFEPTLNGPSATPGKQPRRSTRVSDS